MKKRPDLNQSVEISNLVGINLSTTLILMKRLLIAKFKARKVDISFEDWMNLLPLIQQKDLNQNDLAKALGKDKANISRLVEQWQKQGLLRKHRSPTDSRAFLLSPTEKALRLHKSAEKIVIEADTIFADNLTEKEVTLLLGLLPKIQYSTQKRLDSL